MSDLDQLHNRLAALCDSALSRDKFDRVSIVLWRSDNPKSSIIVGNQIDTDDLRNVLAAIDTNPANQPAPKQPKTTTDQLQPLGYVLYQDSLSPLRFTLDAVPQRDNSILWAIRRGERVCYNRSTKRFDYEPQPSSRTERYYKTHRFATIEEALKAWDSYKRTKDYADMMARYTPSEANDA